MTWDPPVTVDLAAVSGFKFQKSHKKLHGGKTRHIRSLSLGHEFLIINPSIFCPFLQACGLALDALHKDFMA